MKYRPIIMGAESVRAILEGRKTMTRRVVKADISNCFDLEHDGTLQLMEIEDRNGDLISIFECCPYGKVGDRLWVRETWAEPHYWTNDIDAETPIYRECDRKEPIKQVKWKSPMFMPRWASRITLEITDIRVERLQDITEEDADAELFGGYDPYSIVPEIFNINDDSYKTIPECFGKFWDYLNAKRGYPWESNPWVWCIGFKRVHDQKEDV